VTNNVLGSTQLVNYTCNHVDLYTCKQINRKEESDQHNSHRFYYITKTDQEIKGISKTVAS